jgi:hypothetical protein
MRKNRTAPTPPEITFIGQIVQRSAEAQKRSGKSNSSPPVKRASMQMTHDGQPPFFRKMSHRQSAQLFRAELILRRSLRSAKVVLHRIRAIRKTESWVI